MLTKRSRLERSGSASRLINGWVLASLVFLTAVIALWAPGGEVAPEIRRFDRLVPAERFDSLFNVVMRASQLPDASAVGPASQAALTSFRQIRKPGADRRFHAAMLALHLRNDDLAAALARDILADRPSHLLGRMIQIRVAQRRGDQALAETAIAALLAEHRAELASDLPEYRDHLQAITGFLTEVGWARE